MFKSAEHRSTNNVVALMGHGEVKGEDTFPADVQIPHLESAESLAEFKRILSDGAEDAPVRITDEARKSFVAVDMHGGMGVVVSTRAFRASPLYASYLRDLARSHINVREELDAKEDAIAGIYERARVRKSGGVNDASRAIGFFRDVVEAAHEYEATDVHWEYFDHLSDAELRFRVDGDLYTYRHVPKEKVLRSLSGTYQELVLKNTNSANAFQMTVAQSAMVPITLARDSVNLRWQSIPGVNGFKVLLRLLDGNYLNYKVRMPDTMGLEPSQLKIINSLAYASGGAVILSGETGSAKSTMLRALSYMVVNRELKSQYAINMPSEYPMPWLFEQSVPRSLEETEEQFKQKVSEMIRVMMRGDLDDMTIGEILDAAVAGLVVELALTGHPVRTTIHADSIIEVFMRLLGGRLKLAADEVASEKFINAVGNQKLIPLLCPDCKVEARDVMDRDELALLESKFGLNTSKMACRYEPGCETCRKKGLFTRLGAVAGGTKGQTLAMELYRPTPEFLDRVMEKDWKGAERVWRAERVSGFDDPDMTGKTVYEHALYKASQGKIDPRFINQSMKGFDVYRVMPGKGV